MTAASPNARGELLVADSFRVRTDEATGAAEVRGFEWHLDRFRTGVSEMLSAAEADAAAGDDWHELVFEPFMETVAERIDRSGAGFPRLELRHDADLGAGTGVSPLVLDLRLRPLPALGSRVDLVSAPFEKARMPWVKGPNLERHTALNRALGAEALLLDSDGAVLEGASTAVVWWTGGAGRHAVLNVIDAASRVPSICERMVVSAAMNAGIAVQRGTITPVGLIGHEVWALNALHGIRPVTAIDGARQGAPNRARLAEFRRSLDQTWHPVVTGAR